MATHVQFAWLMSSLDPSAPPRPEPPLRRRRRRSMGAFVAATAAVAVLTAGAGTAQAAPLKLTDAREAAIAAVAPSPVDGARCFRQPGSRGRAYRARAFCIVNHPPAAGGVCRTFLSVRRGEGSVVARVFGRADCTPSLLQDIEP